MPPHSIRTVLAMLVQVADALGDELQRHYTDEQLLDGPPFEKVILLSRVMIVLCSHGRPIPDAVERLGRKVADPARAIKPLE